MNVTCDHVSRRPSQLRSRAKQHGCRCAHRGAVLAKALEANVASRCIQPTKLGDIDHVDVTKHAVVGGLLSDHKTGHVALRAKRLCATCADTACGTRVLRHVFFG